MADPIDHDQRLLSRSRCAAITAIYDFMRGRDVLLEADLLVGIEDNADEALNKAATRLLLRAINKADEFQQFQWNKLKQIPYVHTDNPLSRLIASLHYMHSMDGALRATGKKRLSDLDSSETLLLSERLMQDLEASRALYPVPVIHTLQEGKIAAITDRAGAAVLFQRAWAEDPAYMRIAEIERGAVSFFSNEYILSAGANDLPSIRAELNKSLAKRRFAYSKPRINLVWSVDANFLRIHGMHWLNMAPFLLDRGYGMIFLVVGCKTETAAAIADAQTMITSLLQFRGHMKGERFADSVIFIPVDEPADKTNIKTLYAGARFIYAPEILEVTDTPVLILDIDMTMKDHLDKVVNMALHHDVGCVFSHGLASFYPWRSCMAGMVSFNKTKSGKRTAGDARLYILRGLNMTERNWTLDQNALNWAMKWAVTNNARMLNFNNMPRPVTQDPVRIVFERELGQGAGGKVPANDGYVFNAKKEHGIEDEYCRLCIYDERREEFLIRKKIPSKSNFTVSLKELPGHFDLKYKIQTYQDERWVDTVKYRRLSAPAG